MINQDLRSRSSGRRSGSSRSSTSDDSHSTSLSSSPTNTISTVATSLDGSASEIPDKHTTPLSGLARRASSIKKIFSKGKKNAALVDEPTSYFVPEPEAEDSLKGWKIAFAGADGENGFTIANILRGANLGLTGIQNSQAGPSFSKTPASSYSSQVQNLWAASESSRRMADISHQLDNPHSLFHTSNTPAELEHFTHMMGGLDALVIDLRSQREPYQKALTSASSLIDPLVPALSVPDQPSLWSVKGKNVMGREDYCQCGRLSPVSSRGEPLPCPHPAETSEHGVLLAQRLCRVLSSGSATVHCPLSTRKFSPPLTPPPAEPVIPYARIVLIADTNSHIQPVIGYFESLQALSSEQIANKLLPRVAPVHPQPRSSSPNHQQHYDESSISSKGSDSRKAHSAPKRSESVETSKSVEIARVSARRLKPIILEASLAEDYLKPALLGKFDDLSGVYFGQSRLPEMKRAVARL